MPFDTPAPTFALDLEKPIERGPALSAAVLADFGSAEPDDVEGWLHDYTVKCSGCGSRWHETAADVPTAQCDDGFLCEPCADDVEVDDAPSFYRGNLAVFL